MAGKNSVAVGSWYWTLRWMIGFFTVVGNGVVIFLIVRRRRLWIVPNLYILSLAVADFSVGLFVIPSWHACTFMFHCDWSLAKNFYNLLFYVSVGNLCLMTADRYFAVVHPFRYVARYATAKKAACFIALAWLIPTVLSIVTLAWIKTSVQQKEAETYYRMAIVFLLEVIPCTAMVMIYIRIFQIVRRHARQISCQRTRALTLFSNSSAPAVPGGLSLNQASPLPKDTSTANATATVVGFFVFCWILSAGRSFCDFFHSCSVPYSVVLVSRLLMLLNSAVNPVIYALMKKDIASEMKDSCRWCIWHKFRVRERGIK